jgi:hypothetical protein
MRLLGNPSRGEAFGCLILSWLIFFLLLSLASKPLAAPF